MPSVVMAVEFIVNQGNVGKFKFDVGFNVSYIQNKAVAWAQATSLLGGWLNEPSVLDFTTKTAVGKPEVSSDM